MKKSVEDQLKYFFVLHNYQRRIGGAEMHYFFVEGKEAYRHGLYIASATCLLIGIEASVRALHAYHFRGINDLNLNPGQTLSNPLLHKARCVGLKIEILAMEGEEEFERKMALGQKRREHVEIVRLRNNLCHGNVKEFFTHIEGQGTFFTPEALKKACEQLLNVSKPWAEEIGRFNDEVLAKKHLQDD
ncbi:hypothetical protein [Vreelandella salicampi]|uniref:HEPN domain-containing protein n=1 Tax=Vreelandella salicampi TaxID=1449798 RepID=A0A7Z0LMJ4_9GAMM|nr:hypothetical protein [Halomonas salicampi]NYS61639.1 hypothetical protein [Halomonas salicampi]